ncbi:hypothetical protein ACN6IR_00805 [Gardnerella vaginalis]|uniref:hypothetical protein n=1 Tax=Gardnerella vaginalis TaxID=2702 RepID=UPI001D00B497|nr:hypothetical protein [Gardnerella vaginalis]
MFLDEFVGHAFGFPDCHPPFFGVAVLALGLQVEAFWFLACVLGVWWFENWIVDASKNSETVFGFACFYFYQFQPAPFWWSRLIVL